MVSIANCKNFIIAFCFLVFSGCTLVPKPIQDEVFADQAKRDQLLVTANQEPVTGPVSLFEAIARSLKYNLDFHLEMAKKILSNTELDISRYELLPQLVTDLSYNGRDNYSGSSSQSLLTGIQSLQTSTSSDRDIKSRSFTLSWNVLDFGISYLRAKQAADKVLVSEEEKRKVVSRMIQDTRAAYWRAVSNERLSSKMDALLVKVTQAIEDSKRIEMERLDKPLTALTYQRELISIKRELEGLRRELALAKIQLAALMNLPLGESYSLVIPDRTREVKNIGMSPQLMAQIALENRPEIREVTYQKRINSYETKAALLGLFPGLNLDIGQNYNSNSFLFNNDWISYGARLSWSLINLIKQPATKRKFNAQDKILDARRLTLSMAIMTQVYVAFAQYNFAKNEFDTAADFYSTQQKILDQILSAEQTNTVSQQSVIREEMNMLVAEVKYDIAYSDLENSYAAIFAALGLDPSPGGDYMLPLETLSDMLEKKFGSMSLYDQVYMMKVN